MRHLRITIGNRSYEVTVEDLTEPAVHTAGTRSAPLAVPAAAVPNPVTPVQSPQGSTASGAIVSPMAGAILAVHVKPGDSVKPGQSLLILEAMKMENQISAPRAGTVRSVDVAAGESVSEGHVLLVLE